MAATDPARFASDGTDLEVVTLGTTRDGLTAEERAANAATARLLAAARDADPADEHEDAARDLA